MKVPIKNLYKNIYIRKIIIHEQMKLINRLDRSEL